LIVVGLIAVGSSIFNRFLTYCDLKIKEKTPMGKSSMFRLCLGSLMESIAAIGIDAAGATLLT
jgi:hypothetical protein